jgi:hypothetical protein
MYMLLPLLIQVQNSVYILILVHNTIYDPLLLILVHNSVNSCIPVDSDVQHCACLYFY